MRNQAKSFSHLRVNAAHCPAQPATPSADRKKSVLHLELTLKPIAAPKFHRTNRKHCSFALAIALMPVAAPPMSGSSVQGSLHSPSFKLHSRCSRPCRQHRRALRVQAAKTADGPSVAIVGVTGAVGREFLRVRIPSVSSRENADADAVNFTSCLLCCAPDLLHAASNRALALLQVIKERDFPYSNLKMLASGRYSWQPATCCIFVLK